MSYRKSIWYRVCWLWGLCRHVPDHLTTILWHLTSHLTQVAWSSLLPQWCRITLHRHPHTGEADGQAEHPFPPADNSTGTISPAAGMSPLCLVDHSRGPRRHCSLWSSPLTIPYCCTSHRQALGYCVPGCQAFWRKAGFIQSFCTAPVTASWPLGSSAYGCHEHSIATVASVRALLWPQEEPQQELPKAGLLFPHPEMTQGIDAVTPWDSRLPILLIPGDKTRCFWSKQLVCAYCPQLKGRYLAPCLFPQRAERASAWGGGKGKGVILLGKRDGRNV